MKKVFLSSIFFLVFGFNVYCQQAQTNEGPFSYKVVGLFYLQEYDIASKTKTTTTKIPKPPLKFKIVGEEIDDKEIYDLLLEKCAIAPTWENLLHRYQTNLDDKVEDNRNDSLRSSIVVSVIPGMRSLHKLVNLSSVSANAKTSLFRIIVYKCFI